MGDGWIDIDTGAADPVDELIGLVDGVPFYEQPKFVRTLSRGMRMVWGVFIVDFEKSEPSTGNPMKG